MQKRSLILYWVVTLSAYVVYVASGALIAWSVHAFAGRYTLLGVVCFVLSYLVLAVYGLAANGVGPKKLAAMRAEQRAIFPEAIKLPDLTGVDMSRSLLTLSWSADAKTSKWQNIECQCNTFGTWISLSLPTIFVLVVVGCFLGLSNFPLLGIAAFVSLGSTALVRYGAVQRTTDIYYPVQGAVRHAAFIVDPDGIREIKGKSVQRSGWDSVAWAREVKGKVLLANGQEVRMIPDFAFDSRADAKAFVATIIALKYGSPLPEYDWSNYVPRVTGSVAVWPPAIQ